MRPRALPGGRLAGTSTPVLEDLGVMRQLMDPEAYKALALEGRAGGHARRLHPAAGGAGRLSGTAARPSRPRSACSPRRSWPTIVAGRAAAGSCARATLATLIGIGAALVGARRAHERSRVPSPSFAARRWHLAGASRCPRTSERPPLEFEPVFGAFERMAADIRSSQTRWKRRDGAPPPCSRPSPPASSASTPRAGC